MHFERFDFLLCYEAREWDAHEAPRVTLEELCCRRIDGGDAMVWADHYVPDGGGLEQIAILGSRLLELLLDFAQFFVLNLKFRSLQFELVFEIEPEQVSVCTPSSPNDFFSTHP
jgi:hypothetical protein